MTIDLPAFPSSSTTTPPGRYARTGVTLMAALAYNKVKNPSITWQQLLQRNGRARSA